MLEKLNELVGKSYKKDERTFFVESVIQKEQKILIQTDKKLVIIFLFDIEKFLTEIEVIDVIKKEIVKGLIVKKNEIIDANLILVTNHSDKMSNSLMLIFEELTGNPTNEIYKKAKAMTDVANSIVKIQTNQLRCLMLKNNF